MAYGQSSGMVNVGGTMMPDPSKHPELEAMVRFAALNCFPLSTILKCQS